MSSTLTILAIGYGMDGWGSNSGMDKIILFTASRTVLGPTQPLSNGFLRDLLGNKTAGACC
jgi:hypothetical protein